MMLYAIEFPNPTKKKVGALPRALRERNEKIINIPSILWLCTATLITNSFPAMLRFYWY